MIKMKKLNWLRGLAFGCAIVMLASCDDSDEPMSKGDVEFEITDAPSDDASVKGVFVTVADIKVDGQSVSGFTKQTIDLKAYQEGNTKLLATGEQLDAKTYNNLTLVLDLDSDASGNAPGCYVLTNDDTKFNLRSNGTGTAEVVLNKDWQVAANSKTKIVMDFDLRKSIAYSSDQQIRYQFVSDNELSTAIRVFAKANAGTIRGTYTEIGTSNSDKVIVYAYRKGTFNASTETQVQGENDVLFANAVTSAEVKGGVTDKSFTLALLEKGEYELHFASYTEDVSNKLTLQSMLASETTLNGTVGNIIAVEGGVTVDVVSTITIEL
jgi:hypothetical protein